MNSGQDQGEKEELMSYDLGYIAVNGRCAVDFSALWLPVNDRRALSILRSKGFEPIEVDLIALARKRLGHSQYVFRAQYSQAPQVVNCSSLVAWLYAQLGIAMPWSAIEQYLWARPVKGNELRAGDLVFKAAPRFNYYLVDPSDNIGHVGLATGEGTIIHAANARRGVVEVDSCHFLASPRFRGVRRIVPNLGRLVTLLCPPDGEVFSSSHLRWKILQSLLRDP